MAHIVKKEIHGKDYYYLRKSVREGKKVKAICLGYLGKTRKQAEKQMKKILKTKETEKKVMEEKEKEKAMEKEGWEEIE